MNPLSAQELAQILGAAIAAGDPSAMIVGGVSTDTRKLPLGSVFFALRGESFNGDAFAAAALAGGARVAVVQEWTGEVPTGCAVICVSNTLHSLQKLALYWRRLLDIPVVGITGSNGKTSTKDFTTAVLSQQHQVSFTQGNLNNHIGVPLTVLSTTMEHTAAVWEMGMNHSGEIAPLCEIARPKFGIITNIGSAHIENLGSRDAIAEEKGMLGRALPADGYLFLPASCDYHDYLRQRCRATLVSVGNGRGAVRAEQLTACDGGSQFDLVIHGLGSIPVFLPVPGKHMVTNALLAAAVGWKFGLSLEMIAAGLASIQLTHGRLGRYSCEGIQIIDDSYNANPESMAAAIDTLAEFPLEPDATRYAVLGRMAELGEFSAEAHQKIGTYAQQRGLKLIAVGDGAEAYLQQLDEAIYFPKLEDASKWLKQHVISGDAVLFKGSRTAAVERVMHAAFPKN
ncbi:MAG: UDP-N-acetylmuramoyl-tripeptide--D-alanyl-D-alanine ligase [Verrucomicrobia bacterium]|nr:MAG: UDP-N-acetylmuramoyl-tripeptide--D-alanyl-D-alanine ligase [Verrucomicrobiota bacterium]